MTFTLEWCPECGGIGHGKTCRCRDAVDFICGCCKTCGGEGTVPLKSPQGKNLPVIVGSDGKPIEPPQVN